MKDKMLLLLLLITSACAHPVVVQPVSIADKDMSCEQIMTDIKDAERYRQEAHAEDKFKYSYMLIAPAAVSIYNMDKAEKAATERKEGLIQLAKRKECGKVK